MAVALKDLIPRILDTQADWRVGLARDWHAIVGGLATRTCLEKIYEDTVVIGVYESHWMQELYLLSPEIKEAINAVLKVPRIRHVRLKLVEEKKKTIRKVYPKKIRRPDSVVLTSSQTHALARIQDEDLRVALTDFWARCTLFQEKKV